MRTGSVTRVPALVSAVALLVLAAGALAPRPALAATNAASLIKAADAASLVGASPVVKGSPQGGTCTWTGAKAGHKLLVLTYAMKGVPGDAAYMGARRQAGADGNAKIADETGMGERAFSAETSFGAVFVALKQGRVLQLQYWTGSKGTPADVVALRPVMRKAVAAF